MAAIRSGQSPFWPMCYAKTRAGVVIGVNGMDRGFRYDTFGLNGLAEDLGIDAPTAAPTVAFSGSGGTSAGDYLCAYQYIDDETPEAIQSSLSPSTTSTATATKIVSQTVITASTNTRVIKVRFWRSTAGQSKTVYLVTTIGHNGSYSSVANNGGGKCRFTWAGSLPHNLIIGARITVTAGTGTSYAGTHNVTAVTDTTFDTDVNFTSSPSTGTWQLTGYTNDTLTDTQLQASTSMLILTPAGGVNARRFVPPANYNPFVAVFQDRVFYAGVVPYGVGTVSNSSGTVTGVGTTFLSTFVGRYLIVAGRKYPITGFTNSTTITISDYQNASFTTASYVIMPELQERSTVHFSEQDEPESVPVANTFTVQDNVGDDDEITGLMPSGANLYVLKERHIYRASFFAQPIIDLSISLAAERGCVNNRCWCRYEEGAYLMDQSGIYKFTGGSATPISDAIQDIFRDGTIDWSVKKWFFAQTDPVQEVIRFHVSYVGDSSTRPKRWLEYNLRNQTWSTGSCLIELGGACLTTIAGRTRVLVGAENDTIYLFGEGTSDHVTTATRGTVTSATSTTLSDSTASFATTIVDAPVAIVAGTGKGQIRRVSVRNSGTQLTVSAAWTTTPDATSVYLLGAIQFNMRTGMMSFVGNTQNQVERQLRLTYEPTAGSQTIDLRQYKDHNPAAENFTITSNPGASYTTSAGDPSAVIDMNRSASALGTSYVGYDTVGLPGRLQKDSASGPRSMRVEVAGFQADQAIKLYQLEVLGVAE